MIGILAPAAEMQSFERRDIVVFVLNISFVVAATILPFLPLLGQFIVSRYGEEAVPTLITTLVWLTFANLVSISSLTSLNASLGPKSGHFDVLGRTKEAIKGCFSGLTDEQAVKVSEEIRLYKKRLLLSTKLTVTLMGILLLATGATIYSVVDAAPATSVPAGELAELYRKNREALRSVITMFVIITGPVVLGWMWVCDGLAHRAFMHSKSVVELLSSVVNKGSKAEKGLLDNFDDVFKDLRIYGRLIFVVDIPLFIGVMIVTFVKFVILNGADSSYQEGFAAGSVAMHVLAANFVSLFLDKIRLDRDD